MAKGIVIENNGECLMIFSATLIAFSGVFLFFVKSHPVFMYEIIVGLIFFSIGGYLKFYGERKKRKELKEE